MKIARIFRLFNILRICWKYKLYDFLINIPYLYSVRFIQYLNPINWFFKKPSINLGIRLTHALEELGPIFIKFGQLLSVHSDLLEEDIIQELSKLQDKVKPFSGKKAIQILENTWNVPIRKVFKKFNIKAISCASIAQVHSARLFNGKLVAIKILKPDILKIIQEDINLMYAISYFFQFTKIVKKLNLKKIIKELENNLLKELDLIREASNASQFRRNFLNEQKLYIPKIYWKLCRKNILVLEYIYGISIRDIHILKERNTNIPLLAKRGIEIFYTQVFRDNFFHADIHPGNIFISQENLQNPKYIAIDFGIVGTLSNEDKKNLLEIFLAFFKRDYYKLAKLHIVLGYIPYNISIVELADSIRSVCEPIFEKPLKDISFGKILMNLFQILQKYEIQIQPRLLLLQKTLLNIEGIGRKLYPEINLWKISIPILEHWIKKQTSFKKFVKNFQEKWPYIHHNLAKFPEDFHKGLQKWIKYSSYNKEIKFKKENNFLKKIRNFIFNIIILFLIQIIFFKYFVHFFNLTQ